jgi:hypothetical protein
MRWVITNRVHNFSRKFPIFLLTSGRDQKNLSEILLFSANVIKEELVLN